MVVQLGWNLLRISPIFKYRVVDYRPCIDRRTVRHSLITTEVFPSARLGRNTGLDRNLHYLYFYDLKK